MKGRVLVTPRSLTRTPDPALRRLEEAGLELVFSAPGETPDETALLGLVEGCVGWIAGVEKVSDRVVRAARDLRVISRNGTGVDNLPLATASELGIAVLRAEGANAHGVAELAVGLMLALLRSVTWSDAALKAGEWRRRIGGELRGRKVGIVGCGAVGRIVARAVSGFGADVLGHDPCPRAFEMVGAFAWREFDPLLAEADIVTLHCPMPDDGRALLDAGRIARLRDGCHLVNTARAGLVDEAAILAALDDGRLGGFATDVFEAEPPPLGALLRHQRVIATPHVGGFTQESIRAATVAAVDNLLRALAA